MSVGLSQVNFDAQALEDEEEAALEKEDKEREQEIRELLTNELDDDLLDDDNASFSSHDFRNSAHGTGTPYSEISPESLQPYQQDGHFVQDDFIGFQDLPSHRGAFERLPLVTPRAFQLIQQPNDRTQVPHLNSDNASEVYHNGRFNQNEDGENERRERDEDIYRHDDDDFQPRSLTPEEFISGGNNNYSSYKSGSSDDFTRLHGYQDGQYEGDYGEVPKPVDTTTNNNYFGANGIHEGHVTLSPSRHRHWTEYNHNNYDQNFDSGTAGYQQSGVDAEDRLGNGHDSAQYSQDTHQGRGLEGRQITSDNSSPGNYTVHYRGRQNHQERDREQEIEDPARGTDADAPQGGQETADVTQLQILYKARGRKLEELAQRLKTGEEDLSQQIRVLNHQVILMKDEHDGMAGSLEQSQRMVQQCNGEISSLKETLAKSSQQVEALTKSKEEAENKLHMAETTIESLNHQLVEMSRSESLMRSREQHQSIMNTARKRHEDDQLRLKQKLDDTILSLDWKSEEANRLKDELLEKSQMINSLTKNLDDSQKQCQELLTTGTMSEINDLRRQLQDANSLKHAMHEECTSLKSEAHDLQEQLARYEMAVKLGLPGSTETHSDSFVHLGVRNLNKEAWATPHTSKTPLEETVNGLRTELEHCLVSNQDKRKQVKQLESVLQQTKGSLREQEKKVERAEKIAMEQETKAQDLVKKLHQLAQERRDPDEQHQEVLKGLEATKKTLQTLQADFVNLEGAKEDLSELNMNLKQQMAQMVAEFDEDKSTSLEKCRNSCLQLHENGQLRLRGELEEVHKQEILDFKHELDKTNEELLRVKECYLQLIEESRGLEGRLQEQFEREKRTLLEEDESKAVEAIRSTIESQNAVKMEDAKKQWEKDVKIKIVEETEKLKKQLLEEREGAIRNAAAAACVEWEEQRKQERRTDREETITAARREWLQQQETEFQKRLSNAVAEARRLWEEEQRLKKDAEKIEEQLAHQESRERETNQKSRDQEINQESRDHETNQESRDREINQESRDREINKAVELALCQAHADWLKNEEEMRQREIEQTVEVAITNAVAEAKVQWDSEQKSLEKGLQMRHLIHEKARWNKEHEADRAKAVEAAIAIAEVQWLEREQKRITKAVDEALESVRETWTSEKERDIARAVDEAHRDWTDRQDKGSSDVLGSARAQLIRELEQQKELAVQEALREAKESWEQSNLNQDIESLREEILREYDEQKEVEFQESLEEAQAIWLEDSEEQRQTEVNEAIAFLETQYKKGLEEFKHKELREALAKAREQWVKEEEAERAETHKARLAVAHKEWQKTQQQDLRDEIDRALAIAQEAWVVKYQSEVDDRVKGEVQNAVKKLRAESEAGKHAAVQKAVDEIQMKFDSEKKQLEDEIERRVSAKSHEAAQSKWEDEYSALERDYHQQLDQLSGEFERRLKEEQEQNEKEMNEKTRVVLQEARHQWQEDQELERNQLEDQHQQNLRSTMEKIKEQQKTEMETAINFACDQITTKQQDLRNKERQANQKETDRLKQEISRLKRDHEKMVEKKKKIQANERRKERLDDEKREEYPVQDSDTSLSSVDQVTATRSLHELRQHYLDSVAKIRNDVMEHVKQTKSNAAKKIRNEVLKERHSTAKKLRRYYLQCLKQMLEEDRLALETSAALGSTEEKMEMMKRALEAGSPGSERSERSDKEGQPSPLPSTSYAEKESPLTPVKSDVTSNLARDPDSRKSHGRPRGYGPEGESDPQRAVNQPETEFSRKLREFKARKHTPAVAANSGIPIPSGEQTVAYYSAEHTHGRLPLASRSDASAYQESTPSKLIVNTQDKHALRHSPLPKCSEPSPSRERDPSTVFRAGRNERPYARGGESVQSNEAGPVADRDRRALENKTAHTEHVHTYKPLTSRSRTAHSPAFSLTSCESEPYSDLPSVIRVTPECERETTSTGNVSYLAKRTSNKPVMKNAGAQNVENKIGRLAREMPLKGSPRLPSKPRIDIDKRRTNAT